MIDSSSTRKIWFVVGAVLFVLAGYVRQVLDGLLGVVVLPAPPTATPSSTPMAPSTGTPTASTTPTVTVTAIASGTPTSAPPAPTTIPPVLASDASLADDHVHPDVAIGPDGSAAISSGRVNATMIGTSTTRNCPSRAVLPSSCVSTTRHAAIRLIQLLLFTARGMSMRPGPTTDQAPRPSTTRASVRLPSGAASPLVAG